MFGRIGDDYGTIYVECGKFDLALEFSVSPEGAVSNGNILIFHRESSENDTDMFLKQDKRELTADNLLQALINLNLASSSVFKATLL